MTQTRHRVNEKRIRQTIANTIIDAGKLTSYGTPRAQEYLRKWAKDFGSPAEKPRPDAPQEPKSK